MNAAADHIAPEELAAATGEGVRVLVADTGVDDTHPALSGTEIRHFAIERQGEGEHAVVASQGGDRQGHGTAVASIIHRHAPGAEIHSLQVIEGGLSGQSSTVIAGLRWAVDQAYDLVNCSFGTRKPVFLPYYKRIVDRAFCRNVYLVAAGSNQDYRIIEYPSAFPAVLSTDCGRLDPTAIVRRSGHVVEFIACGDRVRVPWSGGSYRTVSGSSFASAHLAAVAARIRQLRPQWNVCEVKSALYRLSRPAA